MRSLLGSIADIRNQTPISYAPTGSRGGWLSGLLGGFGQGAEAQMRAMGSVGTLFAIVNRTSTKTAAVDWHLYRKAKSGKKEDREEVTSHACLDLWNQPNKFMPRQEFVEVFQQHLDLTGEAWWVVARNPRSTLPLELWPVRPDRMEPVPDPDEYLAGYFYTSPDGRQVPLKLDEVIQLRMPNPLDPYRGMGPVQSILVDLDTERYTKEWNRNFFRNSAVPGGVIEIEKRLDDGEFNEMRDRWAEAHKGVANAHRVAIVEQGTWKSRTFSMRDMQFAEMRGIGRDVLLEAFGAHKMSIGVSDDVNLANATAGKLMFAEDLTVPRCERIKGSLNNDLLPLYGATTKGLEWDYDSPVPADAEAENAERTSKAEAAKALVDAGYDPKDVAEAMGLPPMAWRERIEIPTPPAAPAVVPAAARAALPAPRALTAAERWQAQVANLIGVPDSVSCDHTVVDVDEADIPEPPDGVPAEDVAAVEEVDLTGMQAALTAAVAALVATWAADVVTDWTTQLLDAIRVVLAGDDASQLAYLTVDTTAAAALLVAAMAELAAAAADDVVAEAADQDVTALAVSPEAAALLAVAATAAALEGQRYALAAGQEAARLAGGDLSDAEILAYVTIALGLLGTAAIGTALGAALATAQGMARVATLLAAPRSELYASEVLDGSTCQPCHKIHGRWLGTSSNPTAARQLYPLRGYVNCKGRYRCRGTVVGIWRKEGAA